MHTTLLLSEKWRVQKKLSQKSGYDMKKYAQLVDAIVYKLITKYKRKKKTAASA